VSDSCQHGKEYSSRKRWIISLPGMGLLAALEGIFPVELRIKALSFSVLQSYAFGWFPCDHIRGLIVQEAMYVQ
jgi:hypothetical protein